MFQSDCVVITLPLKLEQTYASYTLVHKVSCRAAPTSAMTVLCKYSDCTKYPRRVIIINGMGIEIGGSSKYCSY